MQSSFKKMSILSIVSFVGIFLMQGFWILDSYHERRAHFIEHIHYVLDQVSDEYCAELAGKCDIIEYQEEVQIMDSILQLKFHQSEEMPSYSFKILINGKSSQEENNTVIKTNQVKEFTFEKILFSDNSTERKLILYVVDDKFYFLGSILGWIMLSILLIIVGITAIFINTSFLRKQKKNSSIQSDFIGNMTHELKTPIATISVASEMLMKDRVLDDRKKSKRYSTIIFEENLRLKKLVERVMQIALFENGTMRIKLRETNLHQSIENSFNAISMIIEKRKGSLNKDLRAKDFIFQVDSSHFSNIITNLLENAIKYSPRTPTISITTVDYSDGILISIEDLGIGIAEKYQERIFDRFFRIESGDVKNTQGFGLGLYYVRRVVESHGGFIKVHSREGEGSRFELYFPKL